MLQNDRERIVSCPWRVQKGCTALCQPPKRISALIAERDALVARLGELEKWWNEWVGRQQKKALSALPDAEWYAGYVAAGRACADDLARVVKENRS